VSAHGLNLHQYADDSQLYLSVPAISRYSTQSVHSWRRGVVECQPTAPQPRQDCYHVAGLETSNWEGHRSQHSSPGVIHDDCGYSPRPCGDSRQSADYVGTSWCYVSISIQLSSPAPPCRSNTVDRSKEDSSTRICIFASRLLQLSVVWCYQQPSSTSSSCSKCCRTSCQWHSSIRAHHASIETASLSSLATSTATRIEFKMAVLVYKTLNGLRPQWVSEWVSRFLTAPSAQSRLFGASTR